MPVRWLFLDMNAFFASVEQQVDPDLRGRPVAVVPLDSDHTCCIAASYEAKAYGIKTGTRVGDARRRCPHLVTIVPQSHRRYTEFHHRIVRVVEDCLPEPEIWSVDEMVCRLWDNERRLCDALRMGETIKTRIRAEVGEWLQCSVGLGPNPFLAKVAAEMQKPNGLVALTEEDVPRKLYGLALTDFPGIGRRMADRFARAGVTTTEQMYALSRDAMRRLWGGVEGERWWRLLRGELAGRPPSQRRSLGHSHVLPPELRSPEGARLVAGRLLEKAGERLRHLGFHARRLSVYQRARSGEDWTRQVRFAPSQDTWMFEDALSLLWEHPFREVKQVAVVLSDLLPDADVTGGLFDDPARRTLWETVDRLNAEYGRRTVTQAALLHAPAASSKIAFGKVEDLPGAAPARPQGVWPGG